MRFEKIVIALFLFAGCDNSEPERHREQAIRCEPSVPANEAIIECPDCECDRNDDCTDGENGRCVGDRGDQVCVYDQCQTDSDCGGEVCACGAGKDASNRCLVSNCNIDSDCGRGGYCSPSLGGCGELDYTYQCHTNRDECLDDRDCDGSDFCHFQSSAGKWVCRELSCDG